MGKSQATDESDARGEPAASALSRVGRKKQQEAPVKRGRGRESIYTPEIAAEICARIALGEPLEVICREDGMPSSAVVRDWMSEESRPKIVPASFATDYARARVLGFDAIAAETMLIADSPLMGEETTVKADGSTEVRTGDMLGHRKLQIDTRRWLLSKWDPKRYGDKLAVGGADDLPPIKSEMSENEIARRIAFALHRGLTAQKESQ